MRPVLSFCKKTFPVLKQVFVLFSCSRLPTLLFRDATGNLQEGHELARNANFPPWSPHFRESKGLWSLGQKYFHICDTNYRRKESMYNSKLNTTGLLRLKWSFPSSEECHRFQKLAFHYLRAFEIWSDQTVWLFSGFAQMQKTGLDQEVWMKSNLTSSSSLWTGSISGTSAHSLFCVPRVIRTAKSQLKNRTNKMFVLAMLLKSSLLCAWSERTIVWSW